MHCTVVIKLAIDMQDMKTYEAGCCVPVYDASRGTDREHLVDEGAHLLREISAEGSLLTQASEDMPIEGWGEGVAGQTFIGGTSRGEGR